VKYRLVHACLFSIVVKLILAVFIAESGHYSQDFLANPHSDFFKGQTERGLFYLPKNSEKLSWPNNSKKKFATKGGALLSLGDPV
jgi:hypothetical protein